MCSSLANINCCFAELNESIHNHSYIIALPRFLRLELHTGGAQLEKLEEGTLGGAIGSYTRLELPLEYRYLVFEFGNVFPLVCACHFGFS